MKTENLSPEKKKELIENAKQLLTIFSDLFNINIDDIKPEVYVYDLDEKNIKDIEKETLDSSTKNKDNKQTVSVKNTDNNTNKNIFELFSDIFGDTVFNNVDTNKNNKSISNKTNNIKSVKNTVNTKDSCTNCIKKPNTIREKLLKEAEFDKEKYAFELKQMIIKKVHDILSDDKEHKYKIHKQTDKSPAAAEINLKGMPVFLKDNIYILKDLELSIKNKYEFENVYINYELTKNKDFIDLNIYMIL